MPVALLALAIAAFGIGTTEFVMMGLLPEVASALNTPISTASGYISLYALGVVVGAPVLTAAGMRVRRKTMLLSMMGLFAVGNALTALAPTHESLLAARFLAGLPHGTFFGIGAVVAASLVAHDKRARAISLMFVGLTVANIVGVPAGTLLGQQLGWRWTFGLVAVIGLVALVAVAALVPQQPKPTEVSLRGELTAFKRPQVWLAFAVVVFGFAATFSFYSYIKPLLTQVAGYTPTATTGLLALFGIGMTTGTVIGGRLADRAPMRTLYVFLTALAGTLTLFLVTADSMVLAAINVFLVGVAGFAAIPSIQARILDQAKEAPALGSASIQSTFNIANSLGAYLGGAVVAAGFGFVAPSWTGAILALIGLGFALLSGRLDHRSPHGSEIVATHRQEHAPAQQRTEPSSVD
ncbi:DHA1 family inner membrane transport protein [Halopolyspora algeriensis]|uniref:DHA1 family inner membrane transport protein n=1 Tax=Halopolyspora algeriensis TaxID=1500506 RepID=A0A368W191_9ACTN|nr:MFS transporter [Halopolyspora algeriensis]RCW46984.1 DHA1 family inner membrane transport protein [Halopolyspora algeriensis]TQM48073.1 DHA1 family inner membrane transport protein [Halopolyspora algeriensis]